MFEIPDFSSFLFFNLPNSRTFQAYFFPKLLLACFYFLSQITGNYNCLIKLEEFFLCSFLKG